METFVSLQLCIIPLDPSIFRQEFWICCWIYEPWRLWAYRRLSPTTFCFSPSLGLPKEISASFIAHTSEAVQIRPPIKHPVYFKLRTISVTEPRGKQMPLQFNRGYGQMFLFTLLLCAGQTYCIYFTLTTHITHYSNWKVEVKGRLSQCILLPLMTYV